MSTLATSPEDPPCHLGKAPLGLLMPTDDSSRDISAFAEIPSGWRIPSQDPLEKAPQLPLEDVSLVRELQVFIS